MQAILAGAYKDEWKPDTVMLSGSTTIPAAIADALIVRTTSTAAGKVPLQNVSELVGKFSTRMDANADTTMSGVSPEVKSNTFSPKSYDGFSADLVNNTVNLATGVLVKNNDPNATITRFADATLRALSNTGQTRVWNLMIDVIAQTGRYPNSALALDKFVVEGEQRYWLHVAIDRFTGQIIDKQLELVIE